MSVERLYLDDLEPGDRFASGSHRMERDEVLRFAEAYDPQPFHLDESAAEGTLFGRLAASGWHTAAVTMKLLTASPFRPAPGVIGSGGELAWPRPTYPGDTLRLEIEVLDVQPSRSRPERGTALVRILTLNQDDAVVQSFTPRLVIDRRPREGGSDD